MTDIAEKETAAEILLEAKGFSDAVVSIDGDSVDVVVNTDPRNLSSKFYNIDIPAASGKIPKQSGAAALIPCETLPYRRAAAVYI